MTIITLYQDDELSLTQEPDEFCGVVYRVSWNYHDIPERMTVYRSQLETIQQLDLAGVHSSVIYRVFEFLFPDLRIKHIREIYKRLAVIFDLPEYTSF